jgi:hypothetical protein
MEAEMNEQKQTETENAAKETGGSPMAMGMGMAKKMMAQMGQGGSPFEIMQNMMAQMRSGDDKPPMEKMMGMCMGMCSEMLTAIPRINAMGVFATPELQNEFAGWLDQYEEKVAAALAEGDKDTAALAAAVGVNEDSVRYLVARLAASGKIDLIARLRH